MWRQTSSSGLVHSLRSITRKSVPLSIENSLRMSSSALSSSFTQHAPFSFIASTLNSGSISSTSSRFFASSTRYTPSPRLLLLKELLALERMANLHPKDMFAQAKLMSAWNKNGDYTKTMDRFERKIRLTIPLLANTNAATSNNISMTSLSMNMNMNMNNNAKHAHLADVPGWNEVEMLYFQARDAATQRQTGSQTSTPLPLTTPGQTYPNAYSNANYQHQQQYHQHQNPPSYNSFPANDSSAPLFGFLPRSLPVVLKQTGANNANSASSRSKEYLRQIIIFFGGFATFIVVFNYASEYLGIGNNPFRGLFAEKNEKRFEVETPSVKFSDVKGMPECKAELEEVVEYLRNPEKFSRLGGRMPKGVLLLGPPGVGKTLLAKAVAGEAGVSFLSGAGSEFEEVFVGVGAKRIRELFSQARKRAPCIVFIDEIDAVGGKRTNHDSSYNRASMNQLLTELDGFAEMSGVVVIGATNFEASLDPALTRPGRFDKHIHLTLPDLQGRKEILELYGQKVKLAPTVDLEKLARRIPGSSGADIRNIVNTAAIRAAARNAPHVTQEDLEYSRDKIVMGAELTSALLSDKLKKLIAYHEGGHALVAKYTDGADPLHKITIIPRGESLGLTTQLPTGEKDRVSITRRQLLARLDVTFGGRIAEEMVFGDDQVTTGAADDLKQATNIAKQMVWQHGMGAEINGGLDGGIGLAVIGKEEMEVTSPERRLEMDSEVKKLMNSSYSRAQTILKQHQDKLHLIADALLKHETLTSQELDMILEGKPLDKKSPAVTNTNPNIINLKLYKAPKNAPSN